MTKIKNTNSYPFKKPVPQDYITGTDSETENKDTVSYKFEDIISLLNSLNGSEIISYVFSLSPVGELDENGYGYFLSENNNTHPELVTKLIVSKKTKTLYDLSALFSFLSTHSDDFIFQIRNLSNPNNLIYLNITGIEEDEFQFVFSVNVYRTDNYIGEFINGNVYVFIFEQKSEGSGSSGVPISSVPNIVYGTNNIGNQTVYGINTESLANNVVIRTSDGQSKSSTLPNGNVNASNEDLVNREFVNDLVNEREKTIYLTKFATVLDLSVNGDFTVVSTGLKSPASGTFGNTYAVWLKQTVMDKDVTRAIVTVNNTSSVFGLIRKPSVAVEAGTKASVNGLTNTITIYNGWDGSNTNPGVSVSASIPFSLVSGKQYLLQLEKISSGTKKFSITDISNQQTISITSNNEVNSFSGSCWDAPGVSFESGDVTFNHLSFGSVYNPKPLVMISGDSFVEGNSLIDFGLGAYDKRWDYLIYSALQNDAVISGRGGENAGGLLMRNDIDFFKPKYHLFLIGANDTDFSTWKTNYDAFIAKILTTGAIPVLATIAPRADRQIFINQANTYIKTLPYKVINFAKALSLNNDEVTLNPAYYLADNVHPNLAGHLVMYNQVKIDFPVLFEKDYQIHDAVIKGTLTVTSLNDPGVRTLVVENGVVSSVEGGITGTGTPNFLVKNISSGVIGNSQYYDNGTNTGVGTSDPLSKFNIDKSGQTYNSSTPTAGLVISDTVGGGTQRGIELGTDTNNGIGYLQTRSVLSATWYDLAINPNGGNVRIGNLSGSGVRNVTVDALGIFSASTAVYDGSDAVKITGNQIKAGLLTFNNTTGLNTNAIILNNTSTTNSSSALVATNNNPTGSAATFINSAASSGSGIAAVNSSATGSAINITNTTNGIGIISNNIASVGEAIVANTSTASNGLNFVGKNNGIITYSVNKLGNVTGNSFIKDGGSANQILHADGSVTKRTKGITSITLDGMSSIYNIPHGLGLNPSFAYAGRGNSTNFDVFNTTWDNTNIILTYENPPVAGTLSINWIALE